MLTAIQDEAHKLGEGLLTDREFLSNIVTIIAEKWRVIPEDETDDKDVAELFEFLSK